MTTPSHQLLLCHRLNTLLLLAPLLFVTALASCGDDDESEPTVVPPISQSSDWPARRDSTRALANPPGVDYRLYVDALDVEVSDDSLRTIIAWTNGGPDTLTGDHVLSLQLRGPVSRTLRVGDLPFGLVTPGASVRTEISRAFPPDITSGSYEAYMQIQRTSAPSGPLDIGLQERFFVMDRFFEAGTLEVP